MNPPTKVLLIDDEEPIRRNLRSFLEDSGYEVADACNGQDGMAMFLREPADVVLTDLRMAEGAGMEFIAAMKAQSSDTPLIVVSGTGQIQDAIEAIRQGAWDYLVKPIEEPAVLHHAIDRVLERKRLLLEVRQYQEHLMQRAAQLQALTSRLMTAEHRERRRVVQILHEHFQQVLVSANFAASMLRARLGDAESRKLLQRISNAIHEAIQVSRSLTVELCPPVLYVLGLSSALDWLGRWMREKHGLKVEVKADPLANPQTEDVSMMLFHSVRELLFNVVKHAQIDRATVRMSLADAGNVEIVVSDRGVGFDVTREQSLSEAEGGFGLFSIRERIEAAGGRLVVDSQPGNGTSVTLVAPIRGVQEAV